MSKKLAFQYLEDANGHPKRSQEMIKKYPHIKKLFGRNPYTLGIALAFLIIQFSLASTFAIEDYSWWPIVGCAYLFGAIIHHAFFVIIHEATHNMILKSTWANKATGVLCDICQTVPASIGFRFFHLIHHSNMGEYDLDADLAHEKEAKLVGNNTFKKILWYLFFLIIETLRPLRLKRKLPLDAWLILSIVLVLTSNYLIFTYIGVKALAYLFLSTFFSVGLHPVGARWIQEHYTYKKDQVTYSYYGPLNKLSLNVGYHNEHHDFCKIPWNKLPLLKQAAPEYYDSLYSHRSWSLLLWDFLTNKEMSLYSRIIKIGKGPNDSKESQYSKSDNQNLANI